MCEDKRERTESDMTKNVLAWATNKQVYFIKNKMLKTYIGHSIIKIIQRVTD